MVAYADTGFLVSLYLEESTSEAADAALGEKRQPLPLTPLGSLELRNALNRAVHRQRITAAERDALWSDVETDVFWRRRQKSNQELDNHHESAKRRLNELDKYFGRLDKAFARQLRQNAALEKTSFFGASASS